MENLSTKMDARKEQENYSNHLETFISAVHHMEKTKHFLDMIDTKNGKIVEMQAWNHGMLMHAERIINKIDLLAEELYLAYKVHGGFLITKDLNYRLEVTTKYSFVPMLKTGTIYSALNQKKRVIREMKSLIYTLMLDRYEALVVYTESSISIGVVEARVFTGLNHENDAAKFAFEQGEDYYRKSDQEAKFYVREEDE